MKKYILILFSFFTLNSFAQFTTVDLFNTPVNIGYGQNGYYYKDVTGYFNQFIGTWQYQNGTTTYTLQFKKQTFLKSYPHVNKTYQKDYLIGALKVVKNGVLIYNDLPALNQTFAEAVNYKIFSTGRVENFNDCYMCTYPNQRLHLWYYEPNNDNYAFEDLGFMIHTYTQNGVVKLRMDFLDQTSPSDFTNFKDSNSPPTKTSLFMDFGIFDFVKVP
ncbi:hypothetical protein SAMN05421741_13615 [Paenimyroides ummariense]|uniref:DUF6705 domain-containing protein n=1 Tax=Paenimyroides ummariense TaxID=913024 RepID=A0A1I5G769_9FLAO|nr:DUF6705 family protein [Paenimyroides ummariense]SFO31702.1 hypothetical protein SAMN05421741_13615 [Paenimyroides ummariense]